ncbi:MAG: hypothetical protein E4H14_14260 [Candidatus Thorarchaeota archaeon]|nr:MAG: hypothetical protein E4H14_14260 [Candidatus Thorarchaeota archaeon]
MKSKKAYYAWAGALIFSIVFTFIIWAVGPFLEPFIATLGPDLGAEWYYWKLPAREFMTMLIVWSFYLAHQFSIWGSIYWAQKNLVEYKTKPTSGLTTYNWATLLINAVFIVLHLVQTHVWFDGLAQDVPIITSQGSVIIMLVLILIMENPRRGLFMGRKAGKPITAQVSGFFRRNHQYIIAWALVYTFWFHPMAYDLQLVTGFFYMFLLFTQVSLAYTVVHVNRGWVVLLESFVGVHAFFVAFFNTIQYASVDMWAMFASGFAFMFVFTYIYAFKVRKEIRWVAILAYIGALVWIYLPASLGGYGRPLTYLMRFEFLWIPMILYLLAFAFAGLVYLYLKRRTTTVTY